MGNRTDGIQYLKKQTPSRLINQLKLLASYHLSRWTKRPVMWGLPTSISIEPTTACNLGCPECPSGLKAFTRPTGNLNTNDFEKWIKPMRKHLSYITFYFQGEPYIHPAFLDLVASAARHKIYTATSTNAHFLNDEAARKTVESGLDRLIISIDGTTQEVYESYRVNGKLDKVLEGATNVIKWKRKLKSKTPHVIFQFLVVKPNEHQIDEVHELASSLGVDEVRLKTAQVYDYKNGNPLIPENESYSRYKKRSDGTYAIKNKLHNQCWRMWQSCVITWDGKVVPCCFDKDATHVLGSLKENDMRTIWNEGSYRNFRSQILQSRKNIDICANCSEGTKVWA